MKQVENEDLKGKLSALDFAKKRQTAVKRKPVEAVVKKKKKTSNLTPVEDEGVEKLSLTFYMPELKILKKMRRECEDMFPKNNFSNSFAIRLALRLAVFKDITPELVEETMKLDGRRKVE